MNHRQTAITVLGTAVALVAFASLITSCGPPAAQGSGSGSGPTKTIDEVRRELTCEQLVDFLTSQRRNETAVKGIQRELLRRRLDCLDAIDAIVMARQVGGAGSGVRDEFARAREEFSQELVRLMIQLGKQKKLKGHVARNGKPATDGAIPRMVRWLDVLVGNAGMRVLNEAPKSLDGLTGKELEAAKASNDKLILGKQDYSRVLGSIVAGLLELNAHDQIPVQYRLYFAASVLAEMAQRDKPVTASTLEAAGMLLEIPETRSLQAIARGLNHRDDRVARRFLGIALWMHHRPLVKAIIDELEANGARNMQIYGILGHLTLRPFRLEDLGIERPSQSQFNKKRDEYLAAWHPKFLASWKTWWAKHQKQTVDQWWIAGFAKHGVKVASLRDLASVPALIEALTHQEYVVRLAALNLLQRLTFRDLHRVQYLELTDYDFTRPVRKKYPDSHTRPKLTEKQLLALVKADWQAWWKARAGRKPHQLASEEADRAIALLKKVTRQPRGLRPVEIEAGITTVFFLRHLTDIGVPHISWGDDPDSARERAMILPYFPRLVSKKLGDPAFQRTLADGWWF